MTQLVDSKKLTHDVRQASQGIILHRISVVQNKKLVSPVVKKVPAEFSDVFGVPITLPPSREHDHQIALLQEHLLLMSDIIIIHTSRTVKLRRLSKS